MAAAFGDAPRGWTASRHVGPDIVVVADDADAVARGEFELVVGELHLASNTVSFSVFVNQHPVPAELLAETDRDPGPRLLPMLAKEHKARLGGRFRPRAHDAVHGPVPGAAGGGPHAEGGR